jgi:anti-sigma factor RsiW
VDCNAAKAKLFPYVDGELDGPTRAAVDDHLARCAGCARLAALEFRFQVAFRARLTPEPAPARVRARAAEIVDQLRLTAPAPARRRWRRGVAAAAASLCLVALGATAALLADSMLSGRGALVDLAEAAVDQHQRLSRDLLPADIHGVTPKGAEEWFRKRLPFNISLPDMAGDRLTFRGGRISHLQGVEAAALEYAVDGSDVSLFIVPGEAYRNLRLAEAPRFKFVTRRGYDVIVWQSHDKGVGYALVSEIGGRACLVCHSVELGESAASLAVHR